MKDIKIYILVLIGLLPTLIFTLKFKSYPCSIETKDWESFAVYFNGTTGTLFSILAGILLYLTLKSQNRQNTENTFFNYLNTFSKEKEAISLKLIDIEKKMQEEIHKNQKVEKGSEEEKSKKTEYLNYLKKIFIADYSKSTKTPRLNDEYSKYFRSIGTFTQLITNSNLPYEDQKRIADIFLSNFSDSEIKMICYYYYLLFDIINSSDKNLTSDNYVKKSKIFEGDLKLSDDFLHNYDPRQGDFEKELEEIKKYYRQKRT